MKKLLSIFAIGVFIPSIALTTIACTNNSNDVINITTLKSEINEKILNKQFGNQQNAVDAINNTISWSTEGVSGISAVACDDPLMVEISKIKTKEGFRLPKDTSQNAIDLSISLDLSKGIQYEINKISYDNDLKNSLTSLDDAKKIIEERISQINGVEQATLNWEEQITKNENDIRKYVVSVVYSPSISEMIGVDKLPSDFEGSITLPNINKIDLSSDIKNLLSDLESEEFVNKTAAETQIKTQLAEIKGIETVQVIWGENGLDYTVNVTYKRDFAGDFTFTSKIKKISDLTQTIKNKLDTDLKYFNNKDEVDSKVKMSIAKLEGVREVLEFDWSGTETYKIKISYNDGYGGDDIFQQTIIINKDISSNISDQISNFAKNFFDSANDGELKLKEQLEKIEGVASITINLSEGEYTLTVKYLKGYTGDENYKAMISTKKVISDEIKTEITDVSNLFYNDQKAAEIAIKDKLTSKFTNEISSFNLSWTENNKFTVSVKYEYKYTGDETFTGTVNFKSNITKKIKDTISSLQKQTFDNIQDVNDKFKSSIEKIEGVASVTINNKINNGNNLLSINIVYNSEYQGDLLFDNIKIKFKQNIDDKIKSKQEEFSSLTFSETAEGIEEAKSKIKSLLMSIEGINSVELGTISNGSINISIGLEDGYLAETTFTWTFNIQTKVSIDAIQTQNLSYKTSTTSTTISISAKGLSTYKFSAISNDPYQINASIDNNQLTIKSLNNVNGKKEVKITVLVQGYPLASTSFVVVIEGKPELDQIISSDVPSLVKVRKGASYDIDFTMKFFDPSIDKLTAVPSDNDGQTSGQIITKNAASNLYTLRINGISKNLVENYPNGGFQEMILKVNNEEIWKVQTQVHEYPEKITSTLEGLGFDDTTDTISIYKANKEITFEITLDGLVDANDYLEAIVTDKVIDDYQGALSKYDKNNVLMEVAKSKTKSNTWVIKIIGVGKNKSSWPSTQNWMWGDQYATVWIKNDKLNTTPKRIWLRNTIVKEEMQ